MSEPDVSDLISVSQAIEILDSTPITPRVVEVALDEAQGLRLAVDLVADRDYPPFDKSQMDGIACTAADAQSPPPAGLELIGDIPAGATATRPIAPGQAMRIMTGAPMPAGANTVVPVEFLDHPSPDRARLMRPFKPGNAVAPRGSDCRAGDLVLPKGTRLGPAQLAVAATVGASRVSVFARPRAAVLSTGDEIVPVDATPGPAQIRNSNAAMILGLLWDLGCDPVNLGIDPDRPDVLTKTLSSALGDFDLLLVIGGMSMGDRDYAPAVLKQLGVDLRITKLKIKPGKPFVYGFWRGDPGLAICTGDDGPRREHWPETHVVGLPGNPVSSFVCTVLFASRLVARLAGGSPGPRTSTRTLASPLPANGPREFYQPVRLDGDVAHPLAWKGSSDVFTLASAHALLRRAENDPALPAGAAVRVIEF